MSRLGVVLILILSQAAISAFAAETPSTPDLQQMQKCIDQAEKSDKSGMACAGAIADPCIAKTENGSKGDPKLCARRELSIWVKLLGAAIAEVSKGNFKRITVATQEAQRTWMESREKICRAFDNVDPGMAPGGSDYCRLVETAGRVLTLRKLGSALAEH